VLALILAAKVYFLWPPPLDRSKLNAAVAAQAAAQRMLDQPQSALREAEEAAARLANQLGEAEKKTPDPQAPALQVLREEQRQAYETVRTRAAAVNLTDQDLADRRTAVTIEEETIKRVQTPVRSGISCT
jgi:type II secretory pathway pseudopilin PulG